MKNYTKKNIDRAWFSRLLRHPARKQRVYSYNPGACTRPATQEQLHQFLFTRDYWHVRSQAALS